MAGQIGGCNDSGCWVQATRPNSPPRAACVALDPPPTQTFVIETTPDDGTAGSAAPDNCDIDVAAVEGAGEVRREIEEDGTPDNSVDQKEVGRVLADLGNGVVAGSVQTGTPQSVDLTPSLQSLNATVSQMVGTIHNHPCTNFDWANPNTNSPSIGDWEGADARVAAGADPTRYTLYIMGCDGTMRAFPYKTPAECGQYNQNVQARPIARSC